MKKTVLCMLIICLALNVGVACASENTETSDSYDKNQMDVKNPEVLPSSEYNALKKSAYTLFIHIKTIGLHRSNYYKITVFIFSITELVYFTSFR